MLKRLFTILLISCAIGAYAQQRPKKDTTIILISGMAMQLETTQALNDLYNFNFAEAEKQFRWMKQKYPWHPLPYFLMGLSTWWKIMPDIRNKSYDDRFLADMDSTIMVAERMRRRPEYRIEAAFFLAAAYGFKGRLYSDEDRTNWVKSAAAGKEALNYLDECREMNYLSPELLFGDALYNYFSVWVPENYPALKPLLWFFRKGDKALGLKQLKEVSYNAFYTRIEAMVWLMRIWNSYENDQAHAFQLAEYLYQTFPNNSYFHRYYARVLYSRGMYPQLEQESKIILQRIDSGRFGYESTSGRYASFYLGQIYEARRRLPEAKTYYEQCVRYSELNGATESGYYLYALIALGEINEKLGNKAAAKKYFLEVKKRSPRKNEAFKEARRRLRKLEKGDR
ncbi:MAG: tetratricopeptide repeat protein [Bacteroidota bacterium]